MINALEPVWLMGAVWPGWGPLVGGIVGLYYLNRLIFPHDVYEFNLNGNNNNENNHED